MLKLKIIKTKFFDHKKVSAFNFIERLKSWNQRNFATNILRHANCTFLGEILAKFMTRVSSWIFIARKQTKRRKKCRKFYGTEEIFCVVKKTEFFFKRTEWHSKVAWKLIGKSLSECGKPQSSNMRATSTASEEKKVREKSLISSLLLWHTIVKRPFFFFVHQTRSNAVVWALLGWRCCICSTIFSGVINWLISNKTLLAYASTHEKTSHSLRPTKP